jgi:hypothetical protein
LHRLYPEDLFLYLRVEVGVGVRALEGRLLIIILDILDRGSRFFRLRALKAMYRLLHHHHLHHRRRRRDLLLSRPQVKVRGRVLVRFLNNRHPIILDRQVHKHNQNPLYRSRQIQNEAHIILQVPDQFDRIN